jgi:gamma-glutamyltranspeptidase/glutathione hydrolase
MKASRFALLSFALIPSLAFADNRPVGRSFVTRSEVLAQHGIACTSQPLATQAALDILKLGGSAVDAAIAANAVLGVVEPMSCGIGGDLFAIVWDTTSGRLHGLNASGRSPRALTLAMLKANEVEGKIPERGPLSVSVPGCVDGWFELHSKFGKLPMRDVLAPAIRYARRGFPVSEVIANDWANGAVNVTNQRGSPPCIGGRGAPVRARSSQSRSGRDDGTACGRRSRTFYQGAREVSRHS